MPVHHGRVKALDLNLNNHAFSHCLKSPCFVTKARTLMLKDNDRSSEKALSQTEKSATFLPHYLRAHSLGGSKRSLGHTLLPAQRGIRPYKTQPLDISAHHAFCRQSGISTAGAHQQSPEAKRAAQQDP